MEDNVIRLCVNGRKMEPGMNVQLYTLRDFTLMANWRLNGISADHRFGSPRSRLVYTVIRAKLGQIHSRSRITQNAPNRATASAVALWCSSTSIARAHKVGRRSVPPVRC